MKGFSKKAAAIILAVILVLGIAPLQGIADSDLKVSGKAWAEKAIRSVSNFLSDLTTHASAATQGDLTFRLINEGDEYEVDLCDSSASGSLTIPSTYGGLPVTRIGFSAFEGCTSLTRITIPDSVTTIDSYAFCYCSSLNVINISDNVTSIGTSAFEGCTSLLTVTVPDSVTSIGTSAFQDCFSLIGITLPDSLTHIGVFAFNNTALYNSSLSWKNGVLYIGNHLIEAKSSVTGAITVKDSTKCIADYAFSECAVISSVSFGENSSLKSIGICSFRGCERLTKVTIPKSVTFVGNRAFSNCTALTQVNWNAEEVSDYGDRIFFKAGTDGSGISVVFGDTVRKIPANLFDASSNYYRPKLISVTIGNNVTSIGEEAFRKCDLLTSITIPAGVKSLGFEAFAGCTKLTSININANLEEMVYWDAFAQAGIEGEGINVVFGDSVTAIPGYLFDVGSELSLPNITSVAFGNNVASIGDAAFRNSTGISSLNLPNSLKSIGENTFFGCAGVNEVGIPDSVVSLGAGAFGNCTALSTVTFGEGSRLTSIGSEAFGDCTALESITLPDSVTGIGYDIFRNTALYQRRANWESNALYNGKALIKVKDSKAGVYAVKQGTKCVASGAFYGCKFITNISVPDGVTQISEKTFYNCDSLAAVSLPTSVTSIGEEAFFDCTSLDNVYYSGSEAQWQALEIDPGNRPLDDAVINYNGSYSSPGDTYAVKWVVDGTELCVNYESGAAITNNSIPTKSGYTFAGWTPRVPATMPDENLTFTATWTANTYTVTWSVDGAESSVDLKCGEAIALPPQPERMGYTFEGWTPRVPATMPAEDMTFTAVFELISAVVPTVSINASTTTVNYGDGVKLSAAATDLPEGAKIKWYIDGAEKGEGFFFSCSEAKADMTITAKLVDGDGRVINNLFGNEISDSETIKVNAGFFQKLIYFFKNLFRISQLA